MSTTPEYLGWSEPLFPPDHRTTLDCRNVFSIFSVWHRLTSLFDAVDDPRVPIFQTYMHVTAYVLTIIWAIVRPALTFRSG